jgi:hypothetical protein
MVGSMLYQADDTNRLQVFRADVHDHRDSTYGWTAYSRPRLQIGRFALHTVGKLTAPGAVLRQVWRPRTRGTEDGHLSAARNRGPGSFVVVYFGRLGATCAGWPGVASAPGGCDPSRLRVARNRPAPPVSR